MDYIGLSKIIDIILRILSNFYERDRTEIFDIEILKFVGNFLDVTDEAIVSNRIPMSTGLRNYASRNRE